MVISVVIMVINVVIHWARVSRSVSCKPSVLYKPLWRIYIWNLFIYLFLYVLLIFVFYIYDHVSNDDDDDDDGNSSKYRKTPSFSHIIGFN